MVSKLGHSGGNAVLCDESVDGIRPLRTSVTLPNGNALHLHQVVRDRETDEHFMVAELGDDECTLVQLHRPDPDAARGQSSPGFGKRYRVLYDMLSTVGVPLTAGTTGEPVWAY